jgi:hypothetical protein
VRRTQWDLLFWWGEGDTAATASKSNRAWKGTRRTAPVPAVLTGFGRRYCQPNRLLDNKPPYHYVLLTRSYPKLAKPTAMLLLNLFQKKLRLLGRTRAHQFQGAYSSLKIVICEVKLFFTVGKNKSR